MTYPVLIGGGTTVSPTRTRSQEIISPRGTIGPQEVRDVQLLDTSVNVIYAKHRDPAPTWIMVIGRKFSEETSADVYSRCQMNLTRDAVLAESPNFMNPGLLSVHTSDELGYVVILTNRIRKPTGGSNWLLPGHFIGEVTADRVIKTGSEQNYNARTDFETRGGNQDFGRKNNSMSQPPLDSTPLGTNTTNVTMSPIDLIPVRTKTPDPTPLTLTTDFPEKNRKLHVPGDPDPDPSFPDSSSNTSNSSKNSNSSKSIFKKEIGRKSVGNTRNRTRQTHFQAILIRLTTVTTDKSDVKRRAVRKQIR